jgi:hypothetical protein
VRGPWEAADPQLAPCTCITCAVSHPHAPAALLSFWLQANPGSIC